MKWTAIKEDKLVRMKKSSITDNETALGRARKRQKLELEAAVAAMSIPERIQFRNEHFNMEITDNAEI